MSKMRASKTSMYLRGNCEKWTEDKHKTREEKNDPDLGFPLWINKATGSLPSLRTQRIPKRPCGLFYFALSLKEIGTGLAFAVAVQPRFIYCTGAPWYLTCEKPVSYLQEISVVPYRVCRHVYGRIIAVCSCKWFQYTLNAKGGSRWNKHTCSK